jgi:mycothiol synthase
MAAPQFEIRSIDIAAASDEFYEAMNLYADLMHQEKLPEDPPYTHEERVAGWRNLPGYVVEERWIALDASGGIAASARASYVKDVPENRHLLNFYLSVLSEHRRRGLGRLLLGRVAAMAERTGRPVLITGSHERVPAGEAFLTACGAEKRLEGHSNELLVAGVDPNLVQRWIDGAPRDRFELSILEGAYPEDRLDEIAALWRVMNDAPRGGLDIEDFEVTPDQLRDMDRSLLAVGTERRTLFARERDGGRLAGFTEVFFNPRRPEQLSQGCTGVCPEFRGHGLGRWLKAEMLREALRVYPKVKKIRTGNADMNEPMLKINRELGYKPHIASGAWQLELAKAWDFVRA